MHKRRRFKQSEALKDRLTAFAKEARERAARLPQGAEKDDLQRKVHKTDAAIFFDELLNAPNPQPRSKGG
jgi:hypothetical protein